MNVIAVFITHEVKFRRHLIMESKQTYLIQEVI